MSVNQTDYIFYGAKLPYPSNARDEDDYYDMFEHYRDSHFDEGIGNHDGVTIILDGYDGSYCAIGHIVYKVGRKNYAYPFEIPKTISDDLVDRIRDAIEMMGLDRNAELGWHFLPHYT